MAQVTHKQNGKWRMTQKAIGLNGKAMVSEYVKGTIVWKQSVAF